MCMRNLSMVRSACYENEEKSVKFASVLTNQKKTSEVSRLFFYIIIFKYKLYICIYKDKYIHTYDQKFC